MSTGNGNRGRAPKASPLEAVSAHVEQASADDSDEGYGPDAQDSDELHAWASREKVSLEDLREGVLVVSKIAEAAIEANITNAASIRKLTGPLQVVTEQVKIIAAKESLTSRSVEQMGTEFSRVSQEVHRLRVSMQGVEVEQRRMREKVDQIPAIKDLLMEILARLPDPAAKPEGT